MTENVCCYCNEMNPYCSRVNGGNNYYCIKCISKIEESKIDYWKDCSFEEFLQNFPRVKPTSYSETPFADSIRHTLAQMGIDVPKRKSRRNR